jgi:hypothetical protein
MVNIYEEMRYKWLKSKVQSVRKKRELGGDKKIMLNAEKQHMFSW